MRCAVLAAVTRGFCVLSALLAIGVYAAATIPEPPGSLREPEVLTNLFQFRRWAEQEPSVIHPFRIVAEVCDADAASGVLALRDESGVEFLQLGFQDRGLERGAMVCLAGRGCALRPKGFGLAVVPGMVVDNDGIHGVKVESGTVFLQGGVNPITVRCFNRLGNFSLSVEYEGPGLPRQRIPGSVLFRANVEPATGCTNFSAGLGYWCYEGTWDFLPDFTKYHPARTGVVTNLDLGVRTRNEAVGLEFNGVIKLPREGVYKFYVASDDGSRLFVGESSLDVRVRDNRPAPRAAEPMATTALEGNNQRWVTLEGTVHFAGLRGSGGELQMRVGNEDIRVDVFANGDFVPNFPAGAKVRVSGLYQDIVTEDGSRVPGILLAASWKAVRPAPPSQARSAKASSNGKAANPVEETALAATPPPVVATVAEIKALSPDLAKQRLPVSIRGVVTGTLPASKGAVVQDSTRGIFISLAEFNKAEPLWRGEFCQIDGVTGPGFFAPLVVARRITHLGTGRLPQPRHATWGQLMNGSLDTQYAEIEGVVTAIHDQRIELLTEGGRISLDLRDSWPEVLAGCENALVRIRGCVIGPFDEQTHKIEAGSLRVGDAAVNILQPAPRDLFDVPTKSIGELLFYDPKAAPFRRLKVSGQIVYGRAGEYFLTDGTNGMRVTTRNSELLAAGELVEAVGFFEPGGAAPELKEAVMRQTGRAALPEPTKLAPEHLLQAGYAGTLVQVEATLMNQWRDGSEYVLELQSGFLAFRARINSRGRPVPLPPSGSRLALTGVYVPQGNRSADRNVIGFELLLHSPTGFRVLATPPWWTLRHVLVLAGMLAALLCAALVWNQQLRRKVQQRGRQLESEIRNRERAEQQRTAEAERARIARDLHDELGASLTAVSLLASAGLGEFRGGEKNQERFRAIAEKARALVSGLDVIVWAIDPRRDLLQSFADYLGSYAKELLSASNIVCRLRIPIECAAVTLPGTARHSLFLAVKEALNNVIRHASATEVELQVSQLGEQLQIVIADNGRGFDWNTIQRGDGLTNLQERLDALRGHCHIESQPGKGTTVKLLVPLASGPQGGSKLHFESSGQRGGDSLFPHFQAHAHSDKLAPPRNMELDAPPPGPS